MACNDRIPVQVWLEPTKHQKVKVAAGIEGVTLKKLMKKAVDEYMEKHHKNLTITDKDV